MIESIQFREGVFSLTIALPRSAASCESERSVKFDFGEGGRISKLHRSQLVNFLNSIYTEGSHEVGDLILKLLDTHSAIRRVHFHCFYGASESLEGGTATDEDVKLARGTV